METVCYESEGSDYCPDPEFEEEEGGVDWCEERSAFPFLITANSGQALLTRQQELKLERSPFVRHRCGVSLVSDVVNGAGGDEKFFRTSSPFPPRHHYFSSPR